ncbi:hypothetical protein PICMEDRAFT_17291 [Pichia membranifaciens NRRL Y-2026]|uniref:Hsp70 nucleotide exchange factor FES1 n=1 Tax=Pichia membranifaciens NRRL Y-2026 TaxID=763406 RepID=A0A1E3NIU8_9ASCO|nr:hypothetical protein PICMEDRAFT_17291 [Pichia membranifaciens NRRL Y-2026]ODQ46059.1 hypothetical protein PICMEDRAFT_17291 [Pichia membranifaciens NRRL Y-2026]
MEKLLQWSTAQQSQDPELRAKAPAPDPKLLAQVLGADTGKDDTTLMKEDISVLVCNDPQISVDDKLTALEDFEILVQNLDNANNISPLGIWPEIAKLYTYEGEEQDEFRGLGALITGTAVQNNDKAQRDFLKSVGMEGMQRLLDLTSKENGFNVRARALYAISSLVAHNGLLYGIFVKTNGWKRLEGILSEDFCNDKKDNKVLLRSLSLLKCLLYDEITQENEAVKTSKEDRFSEAKSCGAFMTIIKKLSPDSHVEVNERIVNTLSYAALNKYTFSPEEISAMKEGLNKLSSAKITVDKDDLATLQKFL